MNCPYCGRRIKNKAVFCPYCGKRTNPTIHPSESNDAGKNDYGKRESDIFSDYDDVVNMSSSSGSSIDRTRRRKANKKRMHLFVLIAVFVILLCFAGFVGLKLLNFNFSNHGEGGNEPSIIVHDADELYPLILYADETMFYPKEEKDVRLTVRIPLDISFDTITISDNNNESVAVISEDNPSEVGQDYKEYTSTAHFEFSDPCVTTLTAAMGEMKSDPLDIYCTGHVTIDMMETCFEIGRDLQIYLDNNDLEVLFDEDRGNECLEAVKDWLEADDRVLDAGIVDDSVMYHTNDHVLGMYTPPVQEGYLGNGKEETDLSVSFPESTQVSNAMENWDNNGYPGKTQEEKIYLDGILSPTNSKFLVMTPWKDTDEGFINYTNNLDMRKSGKNHLKMAQQYEKKLGYTVNNTDYIDSILSVVNELTDYGIITLMCHGGHLKRSDGTQSVVFCWPGLSEGYNGREIFEYIAEEAVKTGAISTEDEFYRYFFHEGTFNADHTLMCLKGGEILIGGNFIIHKYQNSFFDNAIFYTGACYGGCDQKLINFCTSHGMQAYIGYRGSVSQPLEPKPFKKIFTELKKKHRNGHTSTLEKAAETHVDLGKLSNLESTVQHRSWRIKGQGNVKGKVQTAITDIKITENGQITPEKKYFAPDQNVEVSFYHFMNQGFDQTDTIYTNEDGTFENISLQWGVYGVTAKSETNGRDSITYSGLTLADDSFDAGILEIYRPTAQVGATVYTINDGNKKKTEKFQVVLTQIENESKDGSSSKLNNYTVQGENGHFTMSNVLPGKYQMTINSKEGTFTESVFLEKSCNYEYESIILGARSVIGTVIDSKTGNPVPGAAVTYEDKNDPSITAGTTTDEDGKYSFENVPEGQLSFQITHENYKDGKAELKVGADPRVYKVETVELEPEEDIDWYQYINDVLGPQYGYADTDIKKQPVNRDTVFSRGGWNNRRGIASAFIIDMTNDGNEDLVLYRFDTVPDDKEKYLLCAELYTQTNDGVIEKKGSINVSSGNYLTSISGMDFTSIRVGILYVENTPYIMSECIHNAYYWNGGTTTISLYCWDGNNLRVRWINGKTAGGTSGIIYSLRDYTSEDSYKEEVFAKEWISNEKEAEAIKAGYKSIGLPSPENSTLENVFIFSNEKKSLSIPSYWDTDMIQKNLEILVSGHFTSEQEEKKGFSGEVEMVDLINDYTQMHSKLDLLQ